MFLLIVKVGGYVRSVLGNRILDVLKAKAFKHFSVVHSKQTYVCRGYSIMLDRFMGNRAPFWSEM